MPPETEQRRIWAPGRPVALHATLGSLRRGTGDPAHQVDPSGTVWRASRTPDGPGTLHLDVRPREGTVVARSWGPGAGWLLDRVPTLLGKDDDPGGFVPRHPVIAATWARLDGWRVPRTGRVLEALVPAVLEQKVQGVEARRAWRYLLQNYGEPAPGPAPVGLRVPPPAHTWRRIPSWDWHRAGVDAQRSSTLVGAMAVVHRLEETVEDAGTADRRLRSLRGVGPWTSAEVRQRAHGDPDAVSVGDFHLAALVGWALVGSPLDDEGMLEVLEPYAGHRYRAVRMIELSGVSKPRFAPRLALRAHLRR